MHKKNKKGIEEDCYKLVSSPDTKGQKNTGKIKKLKMKNNEEDKQSDEKYSFENSKIYGKLTEEKG